MAKYGMVLLVVVAVLGVGPALAGTKDIEVKISSTRPSYHLGEPMAIDMQVTNISARDIQVGHSYPERPGINFQARKFPGISAKEHGPFTANRVIGYRKIEAGKTLRQVIALNRYVSITKPGRYTIDYNVYLMGPIVEKADEKGKYTSEKYEAKGTLEITVDAGPIDDKWIKELIGVLQQKEQPAKEVVGEPKGKVTKQEAVELLQWAETPLVIEPLIAAAKNKDLPDGASSDVIKGLQKFFKDHERARTGILEIASEGSMGAFQAALAVYEEQRVIIPSQWFMPTLKSGETGKIWMSLEYLKKHGKSEDIELVAPLMKSKNEQIAGHAKQVVEELRDK
jgi:hypothetical protein